MNNEISIFDEYPRVIGYPIRLKIIYSLAELNDYIAMNLKKFDLHLSLYSFPVVKNQAQSGYTMEVDYAAATIDKIYFDIDHDIPDWIDKLKEIHTFCYENDITHRVHLSSHQGSHILIGCMSNLQYKSQALHNSQHYILNKFNIKFANSQSWIGDLTRSFRIPNTYNFKHDCYCVPINHEEIMSLNENMAIKLTEHPKTDTDSYWMGNRFIDLREFDKKEFMFSSSVSIGSITADNLINKEQLDKLNIPYDKFPDCIKVMLSNPNLGFKQRYLLVLYLRDQSFVQLTDLEIISVLKSILSEDKWIHCSSNARIQGHNLGENLLPIKRVLSNLNYKFPSCKQLEQDNLCPKKCARWHPVFK